MLPDVIVEANTGFRIAVEIVVTGDISSKKPILLHENKPPTICIDLSDFYFANQQACCTDVDFIIGNLDSLLQDIPPKRWVRLPDMQNPTAQIEWEDIKHPPQYGCLLFLLMIIICCYAVITS